MFQRILSTIGVMIFFTSIPMDLFSVYCLYLGIYYQQIGHLVYFVSLMVYQVFFCKQNKFYIYVMTKILKVQKFFDQRTFIQEEELNNSKSMICFHPHCVWFIGAILSFNLHLKNVKFLGSRIMQAIPFVGMMTKWWNAYPVDPKSMKKYCEKGENIALLPGGFEEATLTSRYNERVYIKNRKGFIKYALKYGYKIHIAYTFNESQLFWTFDPLLKYRLLLNKIKMLGVFFFSPFLGVLPNPFVSLHTVIGEGIQCPQIENPTKEDIDKYHQIYIENLKKLYYKYKDRYKIKQELEIY